MPTISMFFGIIISMRFRDHNSPHFHVYYQGKECLFDINKCEMLEGDIPLRQKKLVEAWCVIHQDDLLADWKLASERKELYKIEPLK